MNWFKKLIIGIASFLISQASFGCFIMFLTDGKTVLVANHEDWYARDAEISFIPPSEKKYGMVYFDFANEGYAQGGMNTAGLFFDGTRTPHASYPDNDKKQDCHCYIWKKILEECATVEQAITYVQKYKIPELEDIHVMFADKSGHSAVIGVYKEQLQVHYRTANYQLLTNFNLSNPFYGGESACPRYAVADSMFHLDSSVTIGNVQKILSQTSQEDLTVYSNIYNLTTGEVYVYSVYTRNNFTRKARINLHNELKKGRHAIKIKNLF